ncbi:hypothetical protein [Pararhizobium sp. O133]|uniref:hypothetical protein n=1 Tax=Pararhizobium sp. O133 TaxID=3449278 RepID=UPI003F684946
MTDAAQRFQTHLAEGIVCIKNFEASGHEFALRHVWIVSISALDLYMTELVSEAGLRLIDRVPPALTTNLRQVEVPLESVLDFGTLNPSEKLIFFKAHIFSEIQYKSFYKPEKISEALSYTWNCPAKEKWARIFARMKVTGRYNSRTEQDVRDELTLIGDRRDLIAHAVDTPPGSVQPNPIIRSDAQRVVEFIGDLAAAIDAETENQLI